MTYKARLLVGLVLVGLSVAGCAKPIKNVAPQFASAGWHNVILQQDGQPVTQYSLWIAELDSAHTAAQHQAENMANHPQKLRICIVPNLRLNRYSWSMVIRKTDDAGTSTDGEVFV